MKEHRRNGIRYALMAAAFCMIMSIGILSLADEKGTVTVESAKIRASADTSSEQLGSVAKGGNVDIISETTGTDGKTWYQVYVDANTKGYIRADLVEKKDGSNTSSDSTSGSSTSGSDQTATTATAIDAKKGTVVTSNVRIRKGASTNHDVVATANRGMVVTVTGEADGADGKKWYQVSFSYNNKEITGFIRSDLVTFDNVPADTAVSEITGEENSTEIATETAAEETQEQPQQEQTSQASNDSANIILMNVEEVPYIMPGFVAVDLNWNDQKINAYKNGNFYIFYAQKQNGEEGWYLFDSEKGIYQRYAYTSADVTVPDEKSGSGSSIMVILLVIIIVILLAAVGLLVLKLREYTAYDSGYDDDEEDEEYSDDEDFEELGNDEEDNLRSSKRPQMQSNQLVKRPQPQTGAQESGEQTGGRPARRPQPQSGMPQTGAQPMRRPQSQTGAQESGEQTGGRPARRPQPQSGMSQTGAQPMRRPQSQTGAQPVRRSQPQSGMSQTGTQQTRRPQPQGGMARNPQGTRPVGQRPAAGQGNPQGPVRRPQPQNDNVRPQKGYKAKNMLDHDDDDMDFMDI